MSVNQSGIAQCVQFTHPRSGTPGGALLFPLNFFGCGAALRQGEVPVTQWRVMAQKNEATWGYCLFPLELFCGPVVLRPRFGKNMCPVIARDKIEIVVFFRIGGGSDG